MSLVFSCSSSSSTVATFYLSGTKQMLTAVS
jgi:hypothetical protein